MRTVFCVCVCAWGGVETYDIHRCVLLVLLYLGSFSTQILEGCVHVSLLEYEDTHIAVWV